MGNPTGKGGFKPGQSGNPGGMTKEAREMRDRMREKLRGDADEIHDALVSLVKERNAPAVIYAHTLLHGKDPDKLDVEHSGAVENPAKPLTTEQLVAIVNATKKDGGNNEGGASP